MTDPKELGLPFGSWTLDRLQAYLNEKKKIRSVEVGSLSCSGVRARYFPRTERGPPSLAY